MNVIIRKKITYMHAHTHTHTHENGLASTIKKALRHKRKQEVTTNTLVQLGDTVWKNNYFQFFDKTFKRKWDPAIGIHSISFMVDLEKRLQTLVNTQTLYHATNIIA